MPESNFIIKNPVVEDSQNYPLLRETGIKHIEKLAHKIWTDYNVHDPGITIIELLCYAITDLGYRTSYDIKDLLTLEVNGEPVNDSFFHTALHILPSNPVTFNDLRKYLIDIYGVRNAWISKNNKVSYCLDTFQEKLKTECTNDDTDIVCGPLNGLFDILLEREDFVEKDREIYLGKLEEDNATDSYIAVSDQGMAFRVRYPLTIRKVHLYPRLAGATGTVDLQLLERDGFGVYNISKTLSVNLDSSNDQVKTEVELNFELAPGFYRLTAQSVDVELLSSTAADFPYTILQVIDLISSYDAGEDLANYHFFFDWRIHFAVSPVEQATLLLLDKQAAEAGLLVDTPPPSPGGFINQGRKGLRFNALCPFQLQSVDIYPEDQGIVEFILEDKNGNLLFNKSVFIPIGNELTTITLDWDVPPGLQHRLRVNGTNTGNGDIRLYRTNNPTYPFELKNVIEITTGTNHNGNTFDNRYFFFYNWKVTYRPCPIQVSETTIQDIHLAVKDRLHLVRNLCEDFMNIRDLKTEEIAICADIETTPSADLEEVLAEIYYQMELHVAPPVYFYSIEEMMEKGKTTDEIFEGPILDHGFIDDHEFRAIQRRCFLRTSDIIQIIMDVEGVIAVKSILLLSFREITDPSEIQPGDQVIELDDKLYWYDEQDWILQLQDINFFAPDFQPERSKVFFYKNGLPYLANKKKVFELLKEKRAKQIRGKLKGHEKDLPIPVGEFKNLEDYYPIQNDLPETYFVGQNPVPQRRTNLRKAQSNQLKGYLMFFEQILANYFSQLSHIKELFSWEKGTFNTYFTQKIKEVSGIEDIFIPDYITDLEDDLWEIIESQETAEDRKNRFLDHLVGRFAEDFSEYSLLMYSLFKKEAGARLIVDKQAFLGDYPALSSQRGKGFDYRFPFKYDNLSGYQRRLYRLLGIYEDAEGCPVGRRNFASPQIHIDSVLVDDVLYYFFTIEKEDDPGVIIFQSKQCVGEEQICILIDQLLPYGAEEDNWSFNAVDNRWELLRDCPDVENPDDNILGYTIAPPINTQQDFDDMVLAHFRAYANREGFHVIEHILLRKRTLESEDDFLRVDLHTPGEDCDCVEVKDPYSFRATIILPSWPFRFRSTRFRQYVEKMLRLEAPAHIYLKICWINHCEMRKFEICHDDWLERHATLDCKYPGETPLPSISDFTDTDEQAFLTEYRESLKMLIDKLYTLTNVFPVATIHGCDDVDGEEPQISLNNTNLGSL